MDMHPLRAAAQHAANKLWAIPAGAYAAHDWRAAHGAEVQALYAAATLGMSFTEKIGFISCLHEELGALQSLEPSASAPPAHSSLSALAQWIGQRACRWGAINSYLPLGNTGIALTAALRLDQAWLASDGSSPAGGRASTLPLMLSHAGLCDSSHCHGLPYALPLPRPTAFAT